MLVSKKPRDVPDAGPTHELMSREGSGRPSDSTPATDGPQLSSRTAALCGRLECSEGRMIESSLLENGGVRSPLLPPLHVISRGDPNGPHASAQGPPVTDLGGGDGADNEAVVGFELLIHRGGILSLPMSNRAIMLAISR